jgi:putative transposase
VAWSLRKQWHGQTEIAKLEEENRKLKSMYADLALDNKMLKDVLSKKW